MTPILPLFEIDDLGRYCFGQQYLYYYKYYMSIFRCGILIKELVFIRNTKT